MSHPSLLALLAAAAVAVAGCSSTPLDTQAPVETRTPGAGGTAPSDAAGSSATQPQSRVASVDLAAQGAGGTAAATLALPSQRVVYFDFDSFAIRDDAKPVIDGHARALSANKSRKVTVEGHTDDRGGREYNLALGQKRADAVARSLELLGVANGQVEAVSFGKERPAASGSDEQAWAQNRRAEIKDR